MFALEDDVVSRTVKVAVEMCWRQWRSLTAAGLPIGECPVTSVIDPEALVLLSLAVRHHERRLDDQVLWWASTGTSSWHS